MRVIAGQYRSRTLVAPAGDKTRPTSDRLRETLFNVLGPRVADAVFLDLYAGSGAVGIEALSRGAREVIFVELAAAAQKAIRANLAALGIRSGYTLETRSVAATLERFLKDRHLGDRFAQSGPPSASGKTVDLVFLDPPYERLEEYEAVLSRLGSASQALLAPDALVVAEHARRHSLAAQYGGLTCTRVLEQGDAALSFYRAEP